MRSKINNLKFNELNGKVKQVKTTVYEVVKRGDKYVAGKFQEGEYQHSVITFSEEGICLENCTFGFEGIHEHAVFENGRPVSAKYYDKNGNLRSTRICNYYENGLNSEIIDHDMLNQIIHRYLYEYNELLLPVLYRSYLNDELDTRTIFTYNGNDVEKLMYRDKNTYYGKYITRNNAEGKTLENIEYDKDVILKNHRQYKYNEEGELVGCTHNGEYSDYDDHDETEEFEYDHCENWIQKTVYYGDVAESITLREITYYDDESSSKILTIHNNIYDMAKKNNPIPPAKYTNDLDHAQWRWIAEGANENEIFSVERFYTQTYGFMPSSTSMFAFQVELWALKNYLIAEFGADEIYFLSDHGAGYYDEKLHISILCFPRNNYMLKMDQIQHIGSSQYEYSEARHEESKSYGNYIQTGNISIYFPARAFGKRDEGFEKELGNIIQSFRVKKKAEKPEISMVATLGNAFVLKAYPVKDDFVIKDLDLNYGNGFEKFHNQLIERFQKDGKGLILFHGEPGTGKTYYIRHLLRKMVDIKKVVIYMPPNMVDHLVDPSFMTFISSKVAEYAANGRSCILLIEDAEPLLVARDANIRVQGITNLLNMTDGLLNDMLNLQIICTFNVNIKQLDKALLRPGRLTARKEFKALPDFEANILGHQLGIKHIFNAPATLSEIYSHVVDKQTITHTG